MWKEQAGNQQQFTHPPPLDRCCCCCVVVEQPAALRAIYINFVVTGGGICQTQTRASSQKPNPCQDASVPGAAPADKDQRNLRPVANFCLFPRTHTPHTHTHMWGLESS